MSINRRLNIAEVPSPAKDLQSVAVCCSVLQSPQHPIVSMSRFAECCSVLQCVIILNMSIHRRANDDELTSPPTELSSLR